jgi:hypothetical protein
LAVNSGLEESAHDSDEDFEKWWLCEVIPDSKRKSNAYMPEDLLKIHWYRKDENVSEFGRHTHTRTRTRKFTHTKPHVHINIHTYTYVGKYEKDWRLNSANKTIPYTDMIPVSTGNS